MNIRPLGHTQVLQRGAGKEGTSNKECHMTGHVNVLSLLEGQKVKLKQISKWINNPQNTAARGCIESSRDDPFNDLAKIRWRSVSVPGSLGICSARLLFCSKTPQCHLWGEHWHQCNRTPPPPKLRGRYLASNPNNSKQGQIQVETSLVLK